MSHGRVLLVGCQNDVGAMEQALEKAGCSVTVATQATRAVAKVASQEFDCVVSTYDLVGDDGVTLLESIKEVGPTLPTVLYAEPVSEVTDVVCQGEIDRFVRRNGASSLEQLTDEVRAVTSGATEPPQDVSDHEPEPAEIVRAIEDAPIGISLSDASLPDEPLVYINDAWDSITGYDREYALGRNPRFLQGPGTDPETVKEVGDAIGNEDPITVEIQNYRRDGTPFWNELTVAPVTRDDGEITHYVGFQHDVTDRKTAEAVAEERATKLAEERRALQRLLEHVHGLLNEVTDILVTERDQRVIAQRVCDEVASVNGYPACWFGSTTATDEVLELEATTGLHDAVGSTFEVATLPAPVKTALESNEVAACRIGEYQSDHLGVASVGARRFAVIPITYGPKRYGLLGVYGDRGETLDSREQQLFASIGTMIGSRLNAIETQKVLTADRVIDIEVAVEDESFPLATVARKLEAPVEYVGLTHAPEGNACELFCLTTGDPATVDLTELEFVEDSRILTEADDGTTVALTVTSSSPFSDLAEYGASITDLVGRPEQAILDLELPPSSEVRSIVKVLEAEYEGVNLRSRTDREKQARTTLDTASALDQRLTDRQRTALETAQLNGYFEWPRLTDGGDIAETMGITRQTFHQHLRAAERKLVETYLDGVPVDTIS